MNTPSINLHKLLRIPPFNADRQLKWTLANSFWADSNDFLWRVGLLKDNRPHDTNAYFAKLYVDLLMCAECALKSLIISLSTKDETPDDAYLKARQHSHHLNHLYSEVEIRASKRLKLLTPKQKDLLLKANSIGVGYRYSVTTFFFLSQEDYVDRAFQRGLVSSVINYDFITELYDMLHDLKELASKSINKYYGRDNSLSGSNLDKLHQRQDKFFTDMTSRRKL